MSSRTGSAAAEAVHLAAVPLGGPAIAGGPDEAGGPLLPRRGRWAVVDDAGRGDRRADPSVDHPDDLQHPQAAHEGLDPVAHPNCGGGLRGGTVDLDVPTPAGLRRQGTGLVEADCPQPSVDARLIHPTMLARRRPLYWTAMRAAPASSMTS